jgi:hypothetical protein
MEQIESIDALRAAVKPAADVPIANDTPLQIPPEVERLHGDSERPMRG